jgi:hypothetical protein
MAALIRFLTRRACAAPARDLALRKRRIERTLAMQGVSRGAAKRLAGRL